MASRSSPQERCRRSGALPGDALDLQARPRSAGAGPADLGLPAERQSPGDPKFDFKLAWFGRLIAHAQTLIGTGLPVVLAGDFNVVPTNADIYNAWLWRFDAVLQPETREAYARLLAQGWIDATRHLHPGERVYTFWVNADAFRRNAGFRMDFLLVSPALATQLIGDGVDSAHRGREKPSDHALVWIRLAPSRQNPLS